MERMSSDDLDGQGYEEKREEFSSAAPTGDSYTSQPERDLLPGNPNLVGGAPPEPKKTMAEKVKGIFKGRRHDDDTDSATGSGVGNTTEASPYGTFPAGNQYTGIALDPSARGSEESVPHPQGETDTDPAGNQYTGIALDSTARGSEESVPHPQGETDTDALTDQHGNLKPGPHTDSVKRETVFTKIKDKLHGSK